MNDLTFFTNKPKRDLYLRFNIILQNNTQFFDILVGYYLASGFFKLYSTMRSIDKIHVLVGLNVDAKTLESVTDKHIQKVKHLVKGAGILAVDKTEIASMSLSADEIAILKPYFTSEQINKYAIVGKAKKWIIYTDRFVTQNISKYPNIKNHLDKYKEIMTSYNKPYGLHRTRTQSSFEETKLLSLRMTSEPSFTYTDVDTFVTKAYLTIKIDEHTDYLTLTGLLNSRIIYYWLHYNGKRKGQQLQVDKGQIAEIPIVLPDNGDNSIAEVAKEIINIKSVNPAADTSALDAEIDRMVYELYGLTDEEIKVVEEGVK